MNAQLLGRIREEYLEMPGLPLKIEQVERLCGVERTICQQVLNTLVEMKFLCIQPDGAYARATEGADVPRPQPAKAALTPPRRSAVRKDTGRRF